MRRDTRVGLDHLARAGELIQSALSEVTLEQFLGNWEKQSAVERQFMIIGEALIRIRSHEPTIFESIPDSVSIVGFRNVLVHGYDAAEPASVYEFAGTKLIELLTAVRELTAEA